MGISRAGQASAHQPQLMQAVGATSAGAASTSTPLAVGFGIATGEQARAVGQLADGVIVGSALVKRAAESPERVRELALELRAAL